MHPYVMGITPDLEAPAPPRDGRQHPFARSRPCSTLGWHVRPTLDPEHPPRRRYFPKLPRLARRLGALEYTLIALIVLGVAVTIVMAVLNPGS